MTDLPEMLQQATALLRQRRPDDALTLLSQVQATGRARTPVEHLRGHALRTKGDQAGAEAAWRRALAADPMAVGVAADLAALLNALGRPEAAIAASELPAAATATPRLLYERAQALTALRRHDDSAAVHARLVALNPDDAVSLHNHAAALGDAGRADEAAEVARQAIRRGSDAAETWLVLARALQAANHLDDADEAYGTVLDRRPQWIVALRDRAQLAWMRSGNVDTALAILDGATGPAVDAVRAQLYETADQPERAYRIHVGAMADTDANGHANVSRIALRIDPQRALDHARRAADLMPDSPGIQQALATALLAVGRAREAGGIAETLHTRRPTDQGVLALLWTALRVVGDPRAERLYDYASMVSVGTIACPPGWPRLDLYLADLAAELTDLHQGRSHPLHQPMRRGTQTPADLRTATTPAIRAFEAAIADPIHAYLAAIGNGMDPLRSRNTGGYRIDGIWSIKLHQGGYHTDHVHNRGWISSACYIDVPDISATDRAGWLRLGQPGVPTVPAIEAAMAVQPKVGGMVLFPSYMWHGTYPSVSSDRRLAIAFDLLPD